MLLADILARDSVAIDAGVRSKKGALDALAKLVCVRATTARQQEILSSLTARERLGSTGLGHGIAIPHGRLEHLDNVVGAFLKVPEGVDFDALDDKPVDLFFALLVPNNQSEEHLAILANLAELFSDATLVQDLRGAADAETIHALLVAWKPSG